MDSIIKSIKQEPYYRTELGALYCGDTLTTLRQMPDESVNCVVTSPPYWALRDYGVEGQLGLEPTFQEYIDKLCNIFDEVKRVLKKDGTCWVNMGDTYVSSGGASRHFGYQDPKYKNGRAGNYIEPSAFEQSVQPKSLCQIPSRFAIEMSNRGWILRNELIWFKPNCMPSSVKDRFTVDFEKIFFFVKNKKYWFEQQYEAYTEPMNRWGGDKLKADGKSTWDKGTGQDTYRDRNMRPNKQGRNKRCVWKITTKPFKEAHFAVFPEELIKTPILAGCPVGGVVMDIFSGSGTVARFCEKNNHKWVGIDLKPEYCDMAIGRIKSEADQVKMELKERV